MKRHCRKDVAAICDGPVATRQARRTDSTAHLHHQFAADTCQQ